MGKGSVFFPFSCYSITYPGTDSSIFALGSHPTLFIFLLKFFQLRLAAGPCVGLLCLSDTSPSLSLFFFFLVYFLAFWPLMMPQPQKPPFL